MHPASLLTAGDFTRFELPFKPTLGTARNEARQVRQSYIMSKLLDETSLSENANIKGTHYVNLMLGNKAAKTEAMHCDSGDVGTSSGISSGVTVEKIKGTYSRL